MAKKPQSQGKPKPGCTRQAKTKSKSRPALATSQDTASLPHGDGHQASAHPGASTKDTGPESTNEIDAVNTIRVHAWREDMKSLLSVNQESIVSLCVQRWTNFDVRQWNWGARGAMWGRGEPQVTLALETSLQESPFIGGFRTKAACGNDDCVAGSRYLTKTGQLDVRERDPLIQWRVTDSYLILLLETDYYLHRDTGYAYLNKIGSGYKVVAYAGGDHDFLNFALLGGMWRLQRVKNGFVLLYGRVCSFTCTGCQREWETIHYVLVPASG